MIINLFEYLESAATAHPQNTAIVQNAQSVAYAQLYDDSRRIASQLIAADVGYKRPVAVLLRKSPGCIAAFLGVLASGNYYVPLDPSSPIPRLRSILEDLQPLRVVASREDRAVVDQLRDVCGGRVVWLEDGVDFPIDDQAIRARLCTVIDTDPVYVKYTSGSTGRPKGVVLPHRAVVDYIEWAQSIYQLGPDDVIANQAPFTFDVSVQDIYLSVKAGATLHLVPDQHFVFPARLVEYLVEHQVTWFCWVPSVLVSVSKLDLLAEADTSRLRWVTVLGEVMPTKHFNYWREHCPTASLVNTYGPTETAIASTYYVLDRVLDDDEPLPIGRACRNTEVLVLNDDNQPVRDGSIGEICIRGSSLALGYWNDLERTDAAFPDLVRHQHYFERIYRTGDLGYWNERGELMFSGRKDTQIKHLGYRIELGEIETAALAVPGIIQACVLYDEERRELVLVYESPEPQDRGRLRQEMLTTLPRYMLPRHFHHTKSLPLNANGKIDRQLLREQYL